ncbi:hypothetical protein [Methylobacterium sp. 1973]|uniref:hypothetical protein n=1 Tax=Methylobacterium sp. 1973 TaxID=3156421 RepID=UPI0033955B9C
MAQQPVNVGVAANTGTGDAPRIAFTKLNANDAELYANVASLQAILTASTFLSRASNLSDLPSAATARTNLGLGGAAVLNVGTAAGTVAAGNDSRIVGALQSANNLSDLASASTARSNLGAATRGTNSDITSLTGLTTPLSVGQGGTGGNTAATARSGIGAAASGANTDITSLSGPALGAATATTPAAGDNSTRVATTAALQTAIAAVTGGAPFPVRQTVAAGPTSGGLPSFLPATSGSLSITATGVSSTVPLIVTAAQGFGSSGPVNVTWTYTSNPTWTGLAASATNFLYVNASTGAAGFSTLAPIYQAGGTPSTANGQFTFDTVAMIGYMGNGSTATATPLVFVGEVVTSASGVTSSMAYGYNGYYDSGYTNTLASGAGKNHNIGVIPEMTKYVIKNLSSDQGYAVGQVIVNGVSTANGNFGIIPVYTSRTGMLIPAVTNFTLPNATSGAVVSITNASWAYKFVAQRGW